MPTYVRDPLSNVADAFIKLLRTDTLLAAYNWQEWDSDVDAEMPRAYIAVTADAALVEAPRQTGQQQQPYRLRQRYPAL